MIHNITELMADEFVTLHGDIDVKLDPIDGLIVVQGANTIVINAAQLAHLHRITTGMIQMGTAFGSQDSPSMVAEPIDPPD